jgi:hypothetical protein
LPVAPDGDPFLEPGAGRRKIVLTSGQHARAD